MLLSELDYKDLDQVFETLRQEGVARFGALIDHVMVLETIERLPGLIAEEKRQAAELDDKARPQVVADLRAACAANDERAISRAARDLADVERNAGDKRAKVARMKTVLDVLREYAKKKPDEWARAVFETLAQAMEGR